VLLCVTLLQCVAVGCSVLQCATVLNESSAVVLALSWGVSVRLCLCASVCCCACECLCVSLCVYLCVLSLCFYLRVCLFDIVPVSLCVCVSVCLCVYFPASLGLCEFVCVSTKRGNVQERERVSCASAFTHTRKEKHTLTYTHSLSRFLALSFSL